LSGGELCLNFRVAADGFLDPGVACDFFDSDSFGRIEGDHPSEDIFECVAEEIGRSLAAVSLPENIETFLFDEFVVGIVGSGLLEGRVACVHNEEDHSCSEDVNAFALVLLVGDFWGHVALGSQFGPENSCAVLSFEVACESKICYFEDI